MVWLKKVLCQKKALHYIMQQVNTEELVYLPEIFMIAITTFNKVFLLT